MNRTKKYLVLLVTLLCLCCVPCTALAKAKVTSVSMKTKYTAAKQTGTIYAKDKSGKTIWTYKLSSQRAAQGFHASFTTNSKYVFIIDNKTYLRLDKNTGTIIKKKNPGFAFAPHAVAIKADSSHNLYLAEYFGNKVYKVNKNGKIVWTKTLSKKYCWPYKMSISGNTLKITFEAEWSKKTIKINTATGK